MWNTARAAISWLLEWLFFFGTNYRVFILYFIYQRVMPFNVPKKSRFFPSERLVAIVTPSFIRITFLLRCMDLKMGPDNGCVCATAKLSQSSSELYSHKSGF